MRHDYDRLTFDELQDYCHLHEKHTAAMRAVKGVKKRVLRELQEKADALNREIERRLSAGAKRH